MGIAYNTSTVRNGLVLHLDAANKKSYLGTGTVWNDISNSSNNGTLVNSPVFSNNAFSFNGTTQSVSFASNTNLQFLGTLPYTLQAWIYPTAQPALNTWPRILHRESTIAGGRDGYNMWFHTTTGTTTQFYSERFCSGVSAGCGVTLDASVTVNNWHYLVCTYNGTSLQFYRNGVAVGNTQSTSSITNTTAVLSVGIASLAANVPQLAIYNRALSGAEVLQNFNALRGRYGI